MKILTIGRCKPIQVVKAKMKSVHKPRLLPHVPFSRQSIPSLGLFSLTCLDLTSARVLMGASPLFSARARGIDSRASENARIAYCSKLDVCKKSLNHKSWLSHQRHLLFLDLFMGSTFLGISGKKIILLNIIIRLTRDTKQLISVCTEN